jgi:molybdate transport system substrate-binding protein
MRAVSDAHQPGAIGCTQVTEILYTPGVTLVGALPGNSSLRPCTPPRSISARRPNDARQFVEWLTGPRSLALRRAGGFEA